MDLVIPVSAGVIALGMITALWMIVRRIASAGRTLPVTPEWIDELSLERYRPMLRLLDGEDLRFLRSQPGFTPRMASRLRAQRCQIFRGYLRSLNLDFGRICGAVKLLMVQSRHDRPDLAVILVRSELIFASSMVMVYCRLVLYRFGICSVDVTGLIRVFDSMRLELRQLVPAGLSA